MPQRFPDHCRLVLLVLESEAMEFEIIGAMAAARSPLRVNSESGEDYICRADGFVPATVSPAMAKTLALAV